MYRALRSLIFALVTAIMAGVVEAQAPSHNQNVLIQPGLNNSLCMTAAGGYNGASVTLQPCTGSQTQIWSFVEGDIVAGEDGASQPEPTIGQRLRLSGKSDMCLDVYQEANGAELIVWHCVYTSQYLYYENMKIVLSMYPLQTRSTQPQCIYVPGGTANGGVRLMTWECGKDGDPPKDDDPLKANTIWYPGYLEGTVPERSEESQLGTNKCGSKSSPKSMCQNVWINSPTDFVSGAQVSSIIIPCLPLGIGALVDGHKATKERVSEDASAVTFVSFCTSDSRGARLIPSGLITTSFSRTAGYVEIQGRGDLTTMNIQPGEYFALGARAAQGRTLPTGGLVFGNTFGTGLEFHEWASFTNATHFCFRACTGPSAYDDCYSDSILPLVNCNFGHALPFELKSVVDPKRCLTAAGFWNGAPVTLEPCARVADGSIASQTWKFYGEGDRMKIHSDKCLTVIDLTAKSEARVGWALDTA